MNSNETKTDVFQFMSVRSPDSVETKTITHFYIKDDIIDNDYLEKLPLIVQGASRKLRNVFTATSASSIGKLIFNGVFCENQQFSPFGKNASIVKNVLESLLEESLVSCTTDNFLINNLNNREYIHESIIGNSTGKIFLLPSKPKYVLHSSTSGFFIKAEKIIEKHTKEFDKTVLIRELAELSGDRLTNSKPSFLKKLFCPNYPNAFFYKKVFSIDKNQPTVFNQTKAALFDALYTLYVLRRLQPINLEHIIKGLQILHVLEFLAVDEFLNFVKKLSKNDRNRLAIENAQFIAIFKGIYPELSDIDINDLTRIDSYQFIKTKNDLINYLSSTPIIDPIVARLGWYKQPFNDIKPIGIGDLKVVKQWLCGYKAGEISHIHNIMKGELKDRTHRHLEKTEEVFSFSSENSSDTQKETQTTDRFETKREAERAIKTEINVGANTNFTYKNDTYGITASVGGNFAYSNSNQDTQKTASNYARDVMDKAVTQVQNKSSQNRSITKVFETEETNKHTFDNTKGGTHTSGIYRWLDKKYKAQLYNYGKRLMFEFVIPEPAAFYVESKLRAVEFDIEIPVKPVRPGDDPVKIPNPLRPNTELTPADIDESMVNLLRSKYDIGEISYTKSNTKNIFLPSPSGTNSSRFDSDKAINHNNDSSTETFMCPVAENNFKITKCVVSGRIRFWDDGDASLSVGDNKFKVLINDNIIFDKTLDHMYAVLDGVIQTVSYDIPITPQIEIANNLIKLQLDFNDLHWYELTFLMTIEFPGEDKSGWQNRVYNKIVSLEKAKADKINQEKELEFNAKMADYNNKMNQLKSQVVNDIIQGRSEAFNRQTILEELKKHCITIITKEFDSDNLDDILSNKDALEEKPVNIEYDRFYAGDVSVSSGKIPTEAEIAAKTATKPFVGILEINKNVKYPKIKIDVAKTKARYIQFLEQAFEWHNIAYIFYPYFWAEESKWIKLMNRLDYTDNNMTAFLKAGSVRVLIAVTPAYNDAVMHFIATREPWEGGPLPVIGDPLFIPIYEEIRKQQDDLQNAVAEGEPWEFELPTSLVYLQDSSSPIPTDLAYPEN